MDDKKIRSLLTEGKKIQAIKLIISETGWGLKRAKEYAENPDRSTLPTNESIQDRKNADIASQPKHGMLRKNTSDKTHQFIKQEKKINAITFLHQNTTMSLQEAKDYVDEKDNENSISNILGEASPEGLSKEALDAKSRELLAADKKVAAIKLMHIATGMSLKEAHEYINAL